MIQYDTFIDKISRTLRKGYLRRSDFIQGFSLLEYDELECRSFLVFGPKTAAYWTLTDHGILDVMLTTRQPTGT